MFERILRDGVAQQVEPHDGHRETEHRDDDGSWGAEKHQADHQRLRKEADYLLHVSLLWLKRTPWW